MTSREKVLAKLAKESPASQDEWEIYEMLLHVDKLNPQTIVEIGCDGGGFLHTLTKAFPKADIIGVEINERPELHPYRMIFGDSQSEATAHRLLAHIRPAQIDFLFLDGDHHYEFVKREFELYKDMVRPGGIIGFHDTNNRGLDGVEVDRFCEELDRSASHKTADYRTDRMSPGTRLIWV